MKIRSIVFAAAVAIGMAGCNQGPTASSPASTDNGKADSGSGTAETPVVFEATYGLSCKDYKTTPPEANKVITGNATKAVQDACASKKGQVKCDYKVDVGAIGDPAPVCAKDMNIRWRCGTVDHSAAVDGESNGKMVTIACP